MNINLDHISVEHKREALATYCQKRNLCYDLHTNDECPLFEVASAGGGCYANATPNEIERNYELVFGDKEVKEPIEVEKEVDMVNEPPHYKTGIECIEELELVFGVEAVKHFCLCNVWKYRKRALSKNGQEDLDKADWYMAKYKELEGRINHGYIKLP